MIKLHKRYFITKYNPSLWSEAGIYMGDEWTGIEDLKKTGKSAISEREYLDVEQKYIDCVLYLMNKNNIDFLYVADLTAADISDDVRIHSLYDKDTVKFKDKIAEGMKVDSGSVKYAVRLMLRCNIDCRLYSRKKHFIVIISDEMYMHVICPQLFDEDIKKIESSGLFVAGEQRSEDEV